MTKKLERKFKRLRLNKERKQAQKEMKKKLGLFDKTPTQCLTCEKKFDKKNREQVFSWNVVVNREKETVRLYCPDCWGKAKKVLDEFKKHLEEKMKEIKKEIL